MAFSHPPSEEAIRIAGHMRARITGTFFEQYGDDILDFDSALDIDEVFFSTAFKPCKWTLLHRITRNYLIADWNYYRRKGEEHFIADACRILRHYRIPFNLTTGLTSNCKTHIFERLATTFNTIAHETFCLLFSDKELMRALGEKIARAIAETPQSRYPNFLKDKGILKRSSSWPKWLQDALFYREQGRCAKCTTDLARVINPRVKIQIDHIIPISLGGTTDPTNLQMLCAPCNQSKGNQSYLVGEFIYVPWELEQSQ